MYQFVFQCCDLSNNSLLSFYFKSVLHVQVDYLEFSLLIEVLKIYLGLFSFWGMTGFVLIIIIGYAIIHFRSSVC